MQNLHPDRFRNLNYPNRTIIFGIVAIALASVAGSLYLLSGVGNPGKKLPQW